MKYLSIILALVIVVSGSLLIYEHLLTPEQPKPVTDRMGQKEETSFQIRHTGTFLKKQTPDDLTRLSQDGEEGEGEEEEGEGAGEEGVVRHRVSTRLKTLHQACTQYSKSPAFRQYNGKKVTLSLQPYRNISLHYCSIPKISSQTWSAIISSIRKKLNETTVSRTNRIANPNTAMKQVRFVFVRDPYSRLVSAYTDKLFSFNTLADKIGRYIVANFRTNASSSSLKCGHDVTFAEFIRYVIHAQDTGRHRDPHFIPAHDFCDMCSARYDLIGHLETLKQDMGYILNAIQSPVQYTRDYPKEIMKDNISQTLRKLSSKMRQCMGMDEGMRRLWRKCQVRGLIGKDQLYPFTPGQSDNITAEMMITAAHAAMDRSAPPEERVLQKTEALREAFASVPLQDRLKLKELLFLDFQMFGYDPEPEAVFPIEPFKTADSFRYLCPFDHPC